MLVPPLVSSGKNADILACFATAVAAADVGMCETRGADCVDVDDVGDSIVVNPCICCGGTGIDCCSCCCGDDSNDTVVVLLFLSRSCCNSACKHSQSPNTRAAI